MAAGSNAAVGRTLLPDLRHSYSGYVAWRGTVPECEVSDTTRKLLDKRLTFSRYVEATSSGKTPTWKLRLTFLFAMPCLGRRANFTHAHTFSTSSNIPIRSPGVTDRVRRVMIDIKGHPHRNALPIGKTRLNVVGQNANPCPLRPLAAILELVNKTTQPFISTVRTAQCLERRSSAEDCPWSGRR